MNVKKLLIGAMVTATLTACEKEETYMRNYTYPSDTSDPTGSQGSGYILIYEGDNDTAYGLPEEHIVGAF